MCDWVAGEVSGDEGHRRGVEDGQATEAVV